MTARLPPKSAGLVFEADYPRVRLTGYWITTAIGSLDEPMPSPGWWPGRAVTIDAGELRALDTAGAWLLGKLIGVLESQQREWRLENLEGHRRTLFELVQSRQSDIRPVEPPRRQGMLEQVGRASHDHLNVANALLAFIGESASVLFNHLIRPWRLRLPLILTEVEEAGVRAVPIVALLSFLLGVTLAYQGSVQLRIYGANIYIVDLTALTIFRELASLMTAVIVAGRTGAAYTAEIGTMKVTEELDALRTIGIPPFDLLVLPRILGLMITLPLLTLLADVTGIFGAMLMAKSLLDISFQSFLDRIPEAISMASFVLGLIKAPVFAMIIAAVGCFQGFRVTGAADSVGRQTTLSVVQSIFLVIVADAAFSVLFSWFGI
ncbi:MlaE family ABC transporter permease [Thiohalomonas denitrificans]|uniref:MlaE family ABC transporter permease n=1 Tax=Thiohalomonas denitrificans TaxID=415747 RepID=UPI0026ED74DB|nr:ABC transporter permease [Thiohalomonas denitrificans]